MSTVVDPVIARWLGDGPRHGPPSGLKRALAAIRGVEQRPRLVYVSGWLPRSSTPVRAGRPQLGIVPLLLILLALLLVLVSAFYVGSRPRIRIPQSIGPSAQRLMAYQDGTNVAVARIDGSGRHTISSDLPASSSPVFSPDGSRIAFLSRTNATDSGSDLYVVPLDGSSSPIAVSNGVQVLEAQMPEISWSPDGQKIAFASAGTPTRIYVAQADGSAASPVTDETTSRDLPSWETNGDRVAYRSIETNGTTQHLEAVDPASGQVTTIDVVIGPGAQLSHLAWSPMEDNRAHAVSYVSQMGYGGQAQAVIDYTDPTVTTTSGAFYPWTQGVAGYHEYGTRWSPDGKWIAILTAHDGVVLAAADTSLATVYSNEYHGELRHLGNVADCWINWSPDGTALYGGAPNGCTGTVVIPVDYPGSAFTTYTPMSGVTSWQPTAP